MTITRGSEREALREGKIITLFTNRCQTCPPIFGPGWGLSNKLERDQIDARTNRMKVRTIKGGEGKTVKYWRFIDYSK